MTLAPTQTSELFLLVATGRVEAGEDEVEGKARENDEGSWLGVASSLCYPGYRNRC